MRIKNQPIIETDTHLTIRLQQPYWGAWEKYKWEKGIEGFGLSEDLILKAIKKEKKIMISFKYGRYEIVGEKALEVSQKYQSFFKARDGTLLLVVPRTACRKIEKSEQEKRADEKKEHKRAVEVAKAEQQFLL